MEHELATRMRAVERYLLGELSDAERDQFEEHFFDCQACAEEVRAGAIFEANARAVFADPPRPVLQPGWWDWVRLRPAFAASAACLNLLLVGGMGYMGWAVRGLRTQVAELEAPQGYSSFALRGVTRGDEQVIEVPKESRFFSLSLDLLAGQSFRQYRGEILSESGARLFSVTLPRPRTPGEPLNLLIPASSVEPGRRYTLIVRGLEERSTGTPGSEIARHNFLIQRN